MLQPNQLTQRLCRIVLALAPGCGLLGAQSTTPDTAPDITQNLKQFVQLLAKSKADWEKARDEATLAKGTAKADAANSALQQADFRIRRQFRENIDLLLAWLYQPVGQSPTLLKAGILSDVEQKQLTKQIGATGATPGATSLTSKGPSSQLIGLAVENGALQQTVAGTVVTIRGNPAGILTALAKKNLVSAADAYHDDQNLRFLTRFSGSATFDISHGSQPNLFTADNNQLTGYSARVDLYNRRDPRHPAYDKDWSMLREAAQRSANAANGLASAITASLESHPAALAWLENAAVTVETTPTADLEGAVRRVMEEARKAFSDISSVTSVAGAALLEYASARNALIDKAAHSSVTTLEYVNTRQFVQAGLTGPAPPGLSNLKFIYTRQFLSESLFTFNASATLFNYRPKRADGTRISVVRDAQGSAEFDIPLPAIANLGKGTLSFSGLWLRLMQEPLGQKIQINGTSVSTKGTIGVAQIKVSFPLGTGVQVPLAISYATQTEFQPDKSDVRGNIGLTFDMDKLFAKSSQ